MLEFSIKDLRDLIKDKVLSNCLHLLLPKIFTENNKNFPKNNLIHYLPNDALTLANYYYLFRLAEAVAYEHYSAGRMNSLASIHLNKPIKESDSVDRAPDDFLPIVGKLCCADISRVNLFVAIVAWVTTDNFRWHELNPLIPEDLSYGLIYDYYDYVYPFVSTVADINRTEFTKNISEEQLKNIKSKSIDEVVNSRPNCKNIKELLSLQQ